MTARLARLAAAYEQVAEEIAGIADPVIAFEGADALFDALKEMRGRAAKLRVSQVARLLASEPGMSYERAGRLIGLSKGRVGQMVPVHPTNPATPRRPA